SPLSARHIEPCDCFPKPAVNRTLPWPGHASTSPPRHQSAHSTHLPACSTSRPHQYASALSTLHWKPQRCCGPATRPKVSTSWREPQRCSTSTHCEHHSCWSQTPSVHCSPRP